MRRIPLCIAMVALLCASPLRAQQLNPMTLDEVVEILRNGGDPHRVERSLGERCRDFDLDARTQDRLRSAGADYATVTAVATSCFRARKATGHLILHGHNAYYTRMLPEPVIQRLRELNRNQHEIRTAAVSPAGQWVILHGRNGWWHHRAPAELVDRLRQANREGLYIRTVAIGPDDRWVLVVGENTVHQSGLPAALQTTLRDLARSRATITSVALSADGAWVVLHGTNGVGFKGPEELLSTLQELNRERAEIRAVSFLPERGWVVVHGTNGIRSSGLSTAAFEKLQEANAARSRVKTVVTFPVY